MAAATPSSFCFRQYSLQAKPNKQILMKKKTIDFSFESKSVLQKMERDTESCLPSKMIRFVLRKCHRKCHSDPKAKPSKKLTDLNDHCLERIFSYLRLGELLALADINERLKTAAELAFVRNFGRGKLVIWEDGWGPLTVHIPDAYFVFNPPEVASLPKPCRLLRCFGHLISKQDIHVQCKRNEYKLLKYVNKYCGESTTEIVLRRESFYYENKPFPNAETEELLFE